MKRISMVLIAVFFVLCLAGCGKNKPEPTPTTPTSSQPEQWSDIVLSDSNVVPPASSELVDTDDSQEEPAEEKISAEMLENTCWTASELTIIEAETWTVEMPWTGWSVDIILNKQGKCRFLSVIHDSYLEGSQDYADSRWYVDQETNRLCIELGNNEERIEGYIRDGKLYMDCYNGIMAFEQKEMPAPGGQWCMGDLEGSWSLESIEIEGYESSAEDEGMHGAISFLRTDTGYIAYYTNETASGDRTELEILEILYKPEALYYGCPNETWCGELVQDDKSTEYYAAITDRNTLKLLVYTYYDDMEYPAVCCQTYKWEGTGPVG